MEGKYVQSLGFNFRTLLCVVSVLALGACAKTPPAPTAAGGQPAQQPALLPTAGLSGFAAGGTVSGRSEPTLAVQVVETSPAGATHPQAAVTPVLISPPQPSPTPDPYPGWSAYTNIGYGFSLRYPPGWNIDQSDSNREPNFIKISRGEFIFVVGYKKTSENAVITGGSATPGNLHHAGEVTFFGRRQAKTTLEHRGKVKSIYFNDVNTEIPVGSLIFSLRLVAAPGANYAQIDAPLDLQKELQSMIQSFSLTEGSLSALPQASAVPNVPTLPAGWKSYANSAYGFAFDYPQSWTLQEDPHLLKISQGTLTLLVAFKRASESVNLGPDQIPAGQAESIRGNNFYQMALPEQVIRQDGKVKAVFYTGTTPLRVAPAADREPLDFVIILYDFNPNYAAVQIPAALQAETDRIVTGFRSVAGGSQAGAPYPTATPIPGTLAPELNSIIQGPPSWKDTLENGQHWYLLNTGSTVFEIKDGKLRMKVSAPNRMDEWGVSNAAPIQNFYLQGTFITGATCSGSDRYGLLFRAPQPDRGYVLGFSCSGAYRVYKWDGSAFAGLQDWTAAPAIKAGPNQTNLMGVLAEGPLIKVYANGSLLTTLNDSAFLQGQFGLFAGSAETPNLEIFVDEIAYWIR